MDSLPSQQSSIKRPSNSRRRKALAEVVVHAGETFKAVRFLSYSAAWLNEANKATSDVCREHAFKESWRNAVGASAKLAKVDVTSAPADLRRVIERERARSADLERRSMAGHHAVQDEAEQAKTQRPSAPVIDLAAARARRAVTA